MQPDVSQRSLQIKSAFICCAPNDSSHAATCFLWIIANHMCICVACDVVCICLLICLADILFRDLVSSIPDFRGGFRGGTSPAEAGIQLSEQFRFESDFLSPRWRLGLCKHVGECVDVFTSCLLEFIIVSVAICLCHGICAGPWASAVPKATLFAFGLLQYSCSAAVG